MSDKTTWMERHAANLAERRRYCLSLACELNRQRKIVAEVEDGYDEGIRTEEELDSAYERFDLAGVCFEQAYEILCELERMSEYKPISPTLNASSSGKGQ